MEGKVLQAFFETFKENECDALTKAANRAAAETGRAPRVFPLAARLHEVAHPKNRLSQKTAL